MQGHNSEQRGVFSVDEMDFNLQAQFRPLKTMHVVNVPVQMSADLGESMSDVAFFTWQVVSLSDQRVISESIGTSRYFSFIPKSSGNYAVSLTVEDASGLQDTYVDCIEVIEHPVILDDERDQMDEGELATWSSSQDTRL